MTSPGEFLQTPPAESGQDIQAPNYSLSNSGSKKGGKGYRRQLDANGQPKKNFYNPPGKVMRHLAQQSYFDNFYGNQGQFYTLKQKYKTQMCKHFLANNDCPLAQYCQFAHGPTELRQSNDVSKLFDLTVIIATSIQLRKNRARSRSLELQDCAMQDLFRRWRMQVRRWLLLLPHRGGEKKTHWSTSQPAWRSDSASDARKAQELQGEEGIQ